jgi:hypothetical protein
MSPPNFISHVLLLIVASFVPFSDAFKQASRSTALSASPVCCRDRQELIQKSDIKDNLKELDFSTFSFCQPDHNNAA